MEFLREALIGALGGASVESSAESSVESLRWASALSEIVQEDYTDDSAEAD